MENSKHLQEIERFIRGVYFYNPHLSEYVNSIKEEEHRKEGEKLWQEFLKKNKTQLTMENGKKKYKFLLMDSRYHSNPDRATCYTMSDTLKEAKQDRKDFTDGVIVRYEVDGKELKNPEIIN